MKRSLCLFLTIIFAHIAKAEDVSDSGYSVGAIRNYSANTLKPFTVQELQTLNSIIITDKDSIRFRNERELDHNDVPEEERGGAVILWKLGENSKIIQHSFRYTGSGWLCRVDRKTGELVGVKVTLAL